MNHELKCWPQYFQRVKDGTKTFEVRINDRGFQPGDKVTLREFDPMAPVAGGVEGQTMGQFTKEFPISFRVGYVLPLDQNHVVFSLLPWQGLDRS